MIFYLKTDLNQTVSAHDKSNKSTLKGNVSPKKSYALFVRKYIYYIYRKIIY